jgi:threonine/homoserine/homoserine lactone efflux protein
VVTHPSVLESVLVGGGFAFAAAVQPGPLQAFLIARVAATGWRRTLPACLAPLLSDGPIALVALLAVGQLSLNAQHVLRASGGILLLYLSWLTYRQWRRPEAPGAPGSAPRTLVAAVLVNLLNPNPYLGWTLVLGPSVLAAWHDHPANAVALVGAFYGTMVTVLALFVLLVGTARFLGSRAQRTLIGASAIALAVLGALLLVTAARHLGSGSPW